MLRTARSHERSHRLHSRPPRLIRLSPIIAMALAVSVVATLIGASAAVAFTDVPSGQRYAEAIADLSQRGIISGYTDGRFGPDDPVKRAQFAKMIDLTLGLDMEQVPASPFTDLGEASATDPHYPGDYVARAYAEGIVKGLTTSTYGPYEPIKRAQVVTMVVRAVDSEYTGLLSTPPAGFVSDWGAFHAEHGPNADRAQYNGLFDHLPIGDTGFGPWGAMTRGEIAQVLHNLLGLVAGPAEYVNPLTVQAHTDPGHAASSRISAEAGGTVTTTGANGVRYTLTVPADAVLSDVVVTLTPVTTIDGLPLSGGLVGAVEFAPAGVLLLKPATLTIQPQSPVSPPAGQSLTGFGFELSGQEFHLVPVMGSAGALTRRVDHLSGVGVALATPADLQTQRETHPPTSPADRLDQNFDPSWAAGQIASYLDAQWPMVLASARRAVTDEAMVWPSFAAFTKWDEWATADGLEAASASAAAPGFQRGISVLGQGPTRGAQFYAEWARAIKAAVNTDSRLARSTKDVTYAGEIFFLAQLVVHQPKLSGLVDELQIFMEAQKLMRFKLEFTSRIFLPSEKGPAGGNCQLTMTLTRPAQAIRLGEISGSASLVEEVLWPDLPYVTIEVSNSDPTVTMQGNVHIQAIDPGLRNVPSAPHPKPIAPELEIRLPARETTVVFAYGGSKSFPVTPWTGMFSALHEDELVEHGFLLSDWDVPGQYDATATAEKDYVRIRMVNEGEVNEDTSFRLFFDPPA